jgi:hypothetical protein
MISAEVAMNRNMDETWKMLDWCRQQFGPRAPSLDTIDETKFLWGYRSGIFETTYHFARAKDCTTFILRWS